MPDLERELRAAAAYVELPAERDLVPALRARLVSGPGRRLPWRRVAAAAAFVVVVALATTMAVPDARTAVLRLLGIKGATVIRVDELPPAASSVRPFGEAVSLAEAERVVGFRPLLPDLGSPDRISIDRFAPLFVVLEYGRPIRLRLTEMDVGLIEKYTSAGKRVERVSVDGRPGIWVKGRHVVSEPFGVPRIAGNVLLWEQAGLTLRLEGRLAKQRALEIARTVR